MNRRIRVKPGKTQSKIGFAMGLLFCLIGVFFVIPTFGSFGIMWTLMSAFIVITNALNAFTDKGVPSHEIIVDEDKTTEEYQDSPMGKLKELKEMYDGDLITSEEYEKKKKEILDNL